MYYLRAERNPGYIAPYLHSASSFTVIYTDQDDSGFFNPAVDTFWWSHCYGDYGYIDILSTPANSLTSPYTDGVGGSQWSLVTVPSPVNIYTLAFDANEWRYSQSPWPTPIPSGAVLLGAALLRLARARRQKRLG